MMENFRTLVKTKAFQKLTLLTILAFLGVTGVYGVTTLYFYGSDVQVVSVSLEVQYSIDGNEWTDTLEPIALGSSWYARVNVTKSGYAGEVTITWTLQKKSGESYVDVANGVITNVELTGEAGQIIYATSTGSEVNNYDWGQLITEEGTYRIKVGVELP